MSVASEIQRLQGAKSDLATAIAAKGVTVPAATTIDGYATLVNQIQAGGEDVVINGQTITGVYESVVQLSGYRKTVTLNHNLGKTPKLVIGVPEGDITDRTQCFCGILLILNFLASPTGLVNLQQNFGTYLDCSGGNITAQLYQSADSQTITYDTTTLSFVAPGYQNSNIKIHFFVYA